jgi:hypothetical protein
MASLVAVFILGMFASAIGTIPPTFTLVKRSISDGRRPSFESADLQRDNTVFGDADNTSTLIMRDNTGKSFVLAHSAALFGIPIYGGAVAGVAFVSPSNSDGCAAFSENLADTIAMVMRGNCPFTTKALRAQAAGAVALIVVDNHPMCGKDPVECPSMPTCQYCPYYMNASSPCECFLPFMADDGPGSNVFIPSMMIARSDGTALFAQAQIRGAVAALMRWDVPSTSKQVQYSVWYHPDDPVSSTFLTQFKNYVPFLGPTAVFTPHLYVWDGEAVRALDYSVVLLYSLHTRPLLAAMQIGCGVTVNCGSQCIQPGSWYCSLDPDGVGYFQCRFRTFADC